MKELVIFDLDGTLLDSISDLGSAVNHALAKNNYPTHSTEAYYKMVGNGIKKLIKRALPEEAQTDEIILKTLKDFTDYYSQHSAEQTKPYKGISELLKKLREMGVKVAVASNKYQSATSAIVKHYFPDIDFVAVFGQQEGVPIKPDPSIVFHILSIAEVSKANTLYVGDSGVDMETARRACVDSAGVSWGFRSVEELSSSLATHIVHTAEELLEIVEA